jgi:hypothetical protein
MLSEGFPSNFNDIVTEKSQKLRYYWEYEKLRFENFMGMEMWIVVLWVMTLCSVVGGYQQFESVLVTTCKNKWCPQKPTINRK